VCHVYDFADFECDNDGEALTRAHDLRPTAIVDGFELWQQSRLVHRTDRAMPCKKAAAVPATSSLVPDAEIGQSKNATGIDCEPRRFP
jgi:hypothetical protein